MDYSSDLNFIGGKVTRDGTLLLIESDILELEFNERPAMKHNWTIRIIKENMIKSVRLKNVPLVPTEVDMFSDGTILIVQVRCSKDGNDIERNARRYNPNGQLIEAFTLGDGIEHVQIDDKDTIWVSYFDEGIFGTSEWEYPMGSDGLIAYTIGGDKLWGASQYGIIDCYALNVVSTKEVYFYFYDESFLVYLNERKESARYRIEGDTVDQFVFDQKGLIAQTDIYTIKRFQIRNRTIVPKEKVQLIDENGKRIIGPVFMRGSYLYAYGKEAIYKVVF
ncbi:hypothetical protein [Aquibacillus kalidii]|uniref:hypothetical protein n=1 Tax=Aquibacillus kalidii TaxID=2762597 RepID=UPI0016453C51|nr:hypothetical protein [Aquibacillus kalidii]